jgi:purine catabolism regulator
VPFTVRDMLQLPCFSDLEVIAGEKGLDREVKAADVMDAPDVYEWIIGGEVIITTAYVMKDDPMAMENLIIKIEEAGAAALCIKLKRFIDELPDEVLETANKLDFPVIFVPFHYLFSEFINPLLSEVINNQAKRLSISEKIHKSFTQLVIEGGGLQQIVNTLAELIKKDVAFYDVYFDEVYIAGFSSEFKVEINSSSLEELLARYDYYSVKIDKKIYGYLIISDKYIKNSGDKINEYEEISLEHAMTVLKLNIQKKISNHQIETKYRDQFIHDLLFNNIQSLKEVKKRASLYDWTFDKGLVTIIVDIDDFKSKYLEIQSNLSQTLEKVRRNIFLKTKNIVESFFSHAVYTTFSDNIVFIIQNFYKEEYFSNKIKDITNKINEKIKKDIDFTVTIGVGSYKDSVMDIHESYAEAQKAIKLSRVLKKDKIIFYDDLGIYKLLEDFSETDSIKEFYDSYLGSLIQYDDEHNAELLHTLESLIKNDWNIKETAEKLFVHYNTVKYRMKRISKILGIDLQDPEQKFNLALSLKLLKMDK